MCTLSSLSFDRRLEGALLVWRQVCYFVLPVERHEPDLAIRSKVEIDHSQAATFALAPSRIRPPNLSKPTSSRNWVARLRITHKKLLKGGVVLVAQIISEQLRKGRRLNELHPPDHTQLAYGPSTARLSDRRLSSEPERVVKTHAARPTAVGAKGGLKRERELEHDLQVYRAYERDAERLAERGARVERVILDHELKREYQSWLHERDRDRPDYNGHPDRTDEEIRDWALEHDLPYFDDEVHFPDLRIEYQEADGRWDHDDIEVTTEHYRGGHAASVAQSGFSCYGGSTLRIGGRGGSSRGGGGHHGGLAAEMWD